jgi:2-desacetyl-2-hydroxyethyl bacteriochlorophyllide A dehydrogenase
LKAYLIDGVGKSRVGVIAVPEPDAGELLIRVMVTGLCGTDAHIFKGEYFGEYPIVPGHEFSGIVEKTGPGVKHFHKGDRVSADPNIFCDNCPECKANNHNFCTDFNAAGVTLNGAMAAYMLIPEKCAFPIGDISFTHAALIEPLACVVHGQNLLAPKLANRTLIIGAGPIGLMHLQVSKMNGAAFVAVSDVKTGRLDVAKSLGADEVIPAPEVSDYVRRHGGFDIVIDSTGVPSVVQSALAYVKSAGTLLVFGVCPNDSAITVNPYEIFKRELTIMGSFALRKTFGQAIRLVEGGRIALDPLIGRRAALDEMPGLMADFAAGRTHMKTVVYPNGLE